MLMATWLWETLIFLGGLVIGLVVMQRLGKQREDDLKREIRHQQTQFQHYQGQVDSHFVKTAELLQVMSNHTRSLYEHLANGARLLCGNSQTYERLQASDLLVKPVPKP